MRSFRDPDSFHLVALSFPGRIMGRLERHASLLLTFHWTEFSHMVASMQRRLGNVV